MGSNPTESTISGEVSGGRFGDCKSPAFGLQGSIPCSPTIYTVSKIYYKFWMPKNQDNLRRLRREHYQRNRAYYIARSRERNLRVRGELQSFIDAYKIEKGCSKCPEKDPICLDFHHHNDDKEFNISQAVIVLGLGKEKIIKEMAKCIIVCSNCHRKIHRDMRR